MASLWIVNASPVIALAKIGQLRLLESLSDALLIPDAVAAEILAGPSDDPARVQLGSGWGRRASPRNIPSMVLEWGLGEGETAVLSLALEHSPAAVVLDDATARAAAKAMGIAVVGTLGIVARAKLSGLIPSASKLVGELQSAGSLPG